MSYPLCSHIGSGSRGGRRTPFVARASFEPREAPIETWNRQQRARATCNDIDFNNDGLFPDDNDIVSFLSVLAGGDC